MDQLPAELFLSIFSAVNLVISGDVFVEGSQEDHGDHAGQEEDDHEAVEDGEPLDVGVGHAVQDVVPSTGPFNFILGPASKTNNEI